MTLADVNGDASTDLVFLDGLAGLSFHVNDGDGVFEELTTLSLQHPASDSAGVEDFDNDGDFDVFAGSRGGLVLLRSDGRGSFARPELILEGGNPRDLTAVDWDSDGDQDLAFINVGADSLIVLGNEMAPRTSRDCNFNGRPDECDIELEWSRDEDTDGIPDECFRALRPPRFHRGDADGGGSIDATDPIHIFSFMFREGVRPGCLESADANNDAVVDVSDGVFLLWYLFAGGRSPPSPGPPELPCGRDTDPRGGPGDLGCDTYAGC
jgi:hypothetical protein